MSLHTDEAHRQETRSSMQHCGTVLRIMQNPEIWSLSVNDKRVGGNESALEMLWTRDESNCHDVASTTFVSASTVGCITVTVRITD